MSDGNGLKNVLDIISAIVSNAAILVGGFWVYFKFIRHRLWYPKAEIDLMIESALLSAEGRLVHVTMRVTNRGMCLLAPRYAELRLRQVVPVSDELAPLIQPDVDPVEEGSFELAFPMISGREWDWLKGDFELEPGESEAIEADFVIPPNFSVIKLYAYLRNPKKETGLGWTATVLHSFDQTH